MPRRLLNNGSWWVGLGVGDGRAPDGRGAAMLKSALEVRLMVVVWAALVAWSVSR